MRFTFEGKDFDFYDEEDAKDRLVAMGVPMEAIAAGLKDDQGRTYAEIVAEKSAKDPGYAINMNSPQHMAKQEEYGK